MRDITFHVSHLYMAYYMNAAWGISNTVIPRLTSDPANEFSVNEDFRWFSDSANEYGFG
jgi:hypothetical protein